MFGRLHSRMQNHMVLALVSIFIYFIFASVNKEPVIDQLSIVTAYICLFLVATALSIGPLQVLNAGESSINIYLRRDVGIWAGLTGLLHCVIATMLAMTPEYIETYINIYTEKLPETVRASLFLWGSATAFIVALLLLLLLCLSNQRALKLLGVMWWKRLQRLAYLVFILTIAHGLAFQLIEARNLILVGLLLLTIIHVVILQGLGFFLLQKKKGGA